MWQDIAIAVGQFVLGTALIPSVVSSFKPNKKTCLISLVVVIVFAFTFASLGMPLSVASSIMNVVLWGILLKQVNAQ